MKIQKLTPEPKMMNFTLLSRPQLAWNGYGSAPSGLGLAGLPLLPSPTSTSRR